MARDLHPHGFLVVCFVHCSGYLTTDWREGQRSKQIDYMYGTKMANMDKTIDLDTCIFCNSKGFDLR